MNMTIEDFYSRYFEQLEQLYPRLHFNKTSLQKLVSPFSVQLPVAVLEQAQSAIQTLFKISHSPDYEKQLTEKHPTLMSSPATNSGLLMAYDFHYDRDSQNLKLIEINTNASGYLICHPIGLTHNNSYQHLQASPLESLQSAFLAEFPLSKTSQRLIIIDENIEQQKMHLEFLMYQTQLQKWGYQTSLVEASEVEYDEVSNRATHQGQTIDYIYNRYCDFLLSENHSQNLKKIYLNKAATLSPHPKEYLRLADKNRLIEISKLLESQAKPELDFLNSVILKTKTAKDFNSRDEVWSQRKQYFFKPRQSYGSKAVYRGKGISKKAFENIMDLDPIIQEHCPPDVYTDNNDQKWKYDLRFYTYKDHIHLVTARLYQGQLTNFATQNGGFANVDFL